MVNKKSRRKRSSRRRVLKKSSRSSRRRRVNTSRKGRRYRYKMDNDNNDNLQEMIIRDIIQGIIQVLGINHIQVDNNEHELIKNFLIAHFNDQIINAANIENNLGAPPDMDDLARRFEALQNQF